MADERTRIMVVDDESSNRMVVTTILEHAGFAVVEADSALLATHLLASDPVDIVVSDVGLPLMSGLDLLALLRRDRPRLPVILMTAAPSKADADRALSMGAVDYLSKPIDIGLLLRTVKDATRCLSRPT